ncbi:LysE family translocator [Paracoccaceae bacterium GXU_MW_L88]
MSIEFLIAAFVVVLIPGTGVIYTLTTALARGRRAAFWASVGCTLGIVPAILAAFLGLSALLHGGAIVYTILRYAGAAYLLYLAWQTWQDRGPISFSRDVEIAPMRIARTGFLINILNPKLSIFFLAFLPQFLNPALPHGPQLAAMSLVFMGMTFAVFVIYGLLAAGLRSLLVRPKTQSYLRHGTAGLFTLFGGRLLLSDR